MISLPFHHARKRIWLPNAWAYIPCARATAEQVAEACARYGVSISSNLGGR